MTKTRYTIAAAVILLMGTIVPQVAAQTGTLTPSPYQTVLNSSGAPIAGACVWTYTAGTSTPAATYTSKSATVQNANPIIADTSGQFVAYLLPGQSYKYVYETACTPPAHGAVLRTQDGIDAVPGTASAVDFQCVAGEAITAGQAVYLSDGSGAKTPGLCYKADSANTYSSTTPIVGIAPASIASSAAGTVRLAGAVTGLSSLTIGTLPYYVGTAGAITTTAPTNQRFVGYADTATSLVVFANPNATPPNADNAVQDFRLTLTTGTAVTTSDVTAATTVFFTPAVGNRIALANSAGVTATYTSAEISIAVPAVASQMYDVFVFANNITPTLELLAWTNDTTRATAIARTTTGFYTKSGDLTRRWVGSFRTTAVAGQTEDSGFLCTTTKRYVYNYYNRVPRPLCRLETTATWPYTLATIRQANGSTANQVEIVVGIAESALDLSVTAAAFNGSSDGTRMVLQVGIGEDSTTTFASGGQGGVMAPTPTATFITYTQGISRLIKVPAVGRHVYSWNEWSQANGTTNWFGTPDAVTAPAGTANGLTGTIAM